MPRVNFVKKARKDHPQGGIKKGDSYYWWQFKFGPTMYSKTRPKPSQLTRSDYLSTLYGVMEGIDNMFLDVESVESDMDDIKSQIEELRDEQQEKRDNMPEQLQDAHAGETLQERYDTLDSLYNDLESLDLEKQDDENDEEFCDRIRDEVLSLTWE